MPGSFVVTVKRKSKNKKRTQELIDVSKPFGDKERTFLTMKLSYPNCTVQKIEFKKIMFTETNIKPIVDVLKINRSVKKIIFTECTFTTSAEEILLANHNGAIEFIGIESILYPRTKNTVPVQITHAKLHKTMQENTQKEDNQSSLTNTQFEIISLAIKKGDQLSSEKNWVEAKDKYFIAYQVLSAIPEEKRTIDNWKNLLFLTLQFNTISEMQLQDLKKENDELILKSSKSRWFYSSLFKAENSPSEATAINNYFSVSQTECDRVLMSQDPSLRGSAFWQSNPETIPGSPRLNASQPRDDDNGIATLKKSHTTQTSS